MALAVWALSPLCPLEAAWRSVTVQDNTWVYWCEFDDETLTGNCKIKCLVDKEKEGYHDDLYVPSTATLDIDGRTFHFGSGSLLLRIGDSFGSGLKCRNLHVPGSVLWDGSVMDAEIDDTVYITGGGLDFMTIGRFAFWRASMKHVAFECNARTTGDRYNGASFRECPNLESFTVASGCRVEFGEGAFRDCPKLSMTTIPDGVTSIGEYAFSGCTALKRVHLPNSLTNVANRALYNCTALAGIDVAAGDQPLTIEGDAFAGCGAFASVTASVPAEDSGDAYDVTAYVAGLPTPPFGKVTIQPELDPAKVSVKIGSTAAGEAALTPTSSVNGMSLAVGVESAIPGLYYVLKQGTVPGGVLVPDAWKQATSSGGLKMVSSPSKDAALLHGQGAADGAVSGRVAGRI